MHKMCARSHHNIRSKQFLNFIKMQGTAEASLGGGEVEGRGQLPPLPIFFLPKNSFLLATELNKRK